MKLLLLLLIAFGANKVARAESANLCFDLFALAQPWTVLVEADPQFYADPVTYEIDEIDNGFRFHADLKDGVIYFEAILTSPETRTRSSLDGKQVFDKMMAHFGDSVEMIRGYWYYGTNYAQYSQSRRNHLTKEEAAISTWTGQRARDHGFSEVISVTETPTLPLGTFLVVVYFARGPRTAPVQN